MTLQFDIQTDNILYDIVPYIVKNTKKKTIRIVVDTLYFDSVILLSDGILYPTTPCIPELIDVVDAALDDRLLGDVKDDYSVSCVLLHANMGGAAELFDWTNKKKTYVINMTEIYGRLIDLEVAGLSYDSNKNKVLIMLS